MFGSPLAVDLRIVLRFDHRRTGRMEIGQDQRPGLRKRSDSTTVGMIPIGSCPQTIERNEAGQRCHFESAAWLACRDGGLL